MGLGISWLCIRVFSFRRLASYFGIQDGACPKTPLCSKKQEARALVIGQAVRTAAKFTPWTSNCFPQAITARILLGVFGIPYALFFGVRGGTEDKAFEAHAWVTSGCQRVTGGDGFDRFTCVACFVSEANHS